MLLTDSRKVPIVDREEFGSLPTRINKMRRLTALALAFGMSLSGAPLVAAPARGGQGQTASVSGTATSSAGQTVANTTVQLRNLATGQLSGTTTSSATGTFSFTGLPAGNYAVEVVNAAGQIIGTSSSIAVAAGATITGVTVTASAAAAGAAAGAGAAAAGAGAAATGGISTAVIVTSLAAAGGIAGVVVAVNNNDASPSR